MLALVLLADFKALDMMIGSVCVTFAPEVTGVDQTVHM